jgi:hypothetical protein
MPSRLGTDLGGSPVAGGDARHGNNIGYGFGKSNR